MLTIGLDWTILRDRLYILKTDLWRPLIRRGAAAVITLQFLTFVVMMWVSVGASRALLGDL